MPSKYCSECKKYLWWDDSQDEGGLPPPDKCPDCLRKDSIIIPAPFREAFKNNPDIEL